MRHGEIKMKNQPYTFSYDELEKFLRFANKIAPIVPMREATKKKKVIILRQDVDLDFQPSYDVYKIQKKIGITSTFFVLTTASTYNILSHSIRKMLKEMIKDGFEIGLHFDPTIYGNISSGDLQKQVEYECEMLERIIKKPIISISLHNPSYTGEYPQFKGYINAYSKELFEDKRYISDSMRIDPELHPFRGKDPYEFVQHAKKYPLQIVLHPEQFLEKGGDYIDTIIRYHSNQMNTIVHEYFDNLSIIRRKRLYHIK